MGKFYGKILWQNLVAKFYGKNYETKLEMAFSTVKI